MVSKDQFSKQIRKISNTYIGINLMRDLYFEYIKDNGENGTMSEYPSQFIGRVGQSYGIELKVQENKPFSQKKPSPEQIQKHYEWKRESQIKAAAKKRTTKPSSKNIEPLSKNRLRLESQYNKVKAEIKKEREPICQGCGCGGCPLTFSHRIPRSRTIKLLAVKENIDLYCLACHEEVEAGNYEKLLNGADVQAYIKKADSKYYFIKLYKKKDREAS